MYVNIGGDFSVRADALVGIFDLDNSTSSRWTRRFLARAQEAGQIVEATDALPKSFLVTHEFGIHRVYLTRFNAAVLEKRFLEARSARYPIPAKEQQYE